MKFVIRGVSSDVSVTSVILEYNPKFADDLDELILWHCPICNTPLFQYSGNMVAILPGMTHTAVPVLVNCGKCKKRYMINSIVG